MPTYKVNLDMLTTQEIAADTWEINDQGCLLFLNDVEEDEYQQEVIFAFNVNGWYSVETLPENEV